MTDAEMLLKKSLKEHGYSQTTARIVVFNALYDKEPQSINDLVKTLAGSIDRASIYRTISLFEQLGIVQRLQIGWKYKLELSDQFNYHHHHLTCIKCGRVNSLREDLMLEASIRALAIDYGFKPSNHQLEIQGVCPNCQQKNMPQNSVTMA